MNAPKPCDFAYTFFTNKIKSKANAPKASRRLRVFKQPIFVLIFPKLFFSEV